MPAAKLCAAVALAALLPSCGTIGERPEAATARLAVPADWEAHEAIWIGFRSRDTEGGLDETIQPIITSLARHVDVRVVVEGEELLAEGRAILERSGTDMGRIELVVLDPADVYMRDPGPIFLVGEGQRSAVADFAYSNYKNVPPADYSEKALAHDGIDRAIAARLGLPTVSSPLALEGGAFTVNGRGTVIVGELMRRRNPHLTRAEVETELKRVLGCSKVIWLGEGLGNDGLNLHSPVPGSFGIGTGGHTDEYVRFAGPRTVLLAWPSDEQVEREPVHRITRERMARNRALLEAAMDQDGAPLEVIEVPLPDIIYEEFEVTEDRLERLRAMCPETALGDTARWLAASSYLNYVVTNGVVLMPAYGGADRPASAAAMDDEVAALLASVFPGREIVRHDALELNWGGGGMHCITMEQPFLSR